MLTDGGAEWNIKYGAITLHSDPRVIVASNYSINDIFGENTPASGMVKARFNMCTVSEAISWWGLPQTTNLQEGYRIEKEVKKRESLTKRL